MKYFFLIITLVYCNILAAQTIVMTYQEVFRTVSIDNVENPELAIILGQEIKKNSKRKKYLLYENGKSIYKEKIEYQESSNNNPNLEITEKGGSNIIYKDFDKGISISRKYILDKAFLITDSLSSLNWELKSIKKKIGNYNCRKAVIGNNITAWYCPDILINDGPGNYWGLPGLIIELDTPDTFYSLISIKTNNDRSSEIIAPTDGKKISLEEFNKLKKEKLGNNRGIKIQIDGM